MSALCDSDYCSEHVTKRNQNSLSKTVTHSPSSLTVNVHQPNNILLLRPTPTRFHRTASDNLQQWFSNYNTFKGSDTYVQDYEKHRRLGSIPFTAPPSPVTHSPINHTRTPTPPALSTTTASRDTTVTVTNIPDSGCHPSITPLDSQIRSPTMSDTPLAARTASGAVIHGSGITGQHIDCDFITLTHHPDMVPGYNLISTKELAGAGGISVFTPNNYYLFNAYDTKIIGSMIGKGSWNGRTYDANVSDFIRPTHPETEPQIVDLCSRYPFPPPPTEFNILTQMFGFTDASFGDNPITRRSRTGIIITWLGGPLDWTSTSQNLVTRSTQHAETTAFVTGGDIIIHGQHLFQELHNYGIPGVYQFTPTLIGQDNTPAIAYIQGNDTNSYATTRHYEISLHYAREHARNGIYLPFHIDTKYNMADMPTKINDDGNALCRLSDTFRTDHDDAHFALNIKHAQDTDTLNQEHDHA